MDWNDYSALEGQHATFSPSKPSWLNYDEEKIEKVYLSGLRAKEGTKKHKLAHDLISQREKLPDLQRTLNMYVNDAIGFKMRTEQTLFYSFNFFGTADAISFRQNELRIHDLKTGTTKTTVDQLQIYAALFFLEYGHKPFDTFIEYRIYQGNRANIYAGDPSDVVSVMDQIVFANKVLTNLKKEVAL